MVDATKAMESQYLTVDLVANSPTKKLVILGQGEYQETDYGEGKVERLTLPVSIDEKEKLWRPNKDNIKNVVREMDTAQTHKWIGIICELGITTIQGKDSVSVKNVIKPRSED